ncbi:unnamed protein product [Linum trigynum]|uniref:Uncharacterized protein n=1 Tax=Linum trigynum TaxID=586398 RepID=A0AAV2D7K7_9ROSI
MSPATYPCPPSRPIDDRGWQQRSCNCPVQPCSADYFADWQAQIDQVEIINNSIAVCRILGLQVGDSGLMAEGKVADLAAEICRSRRRKHRTKLEMERHRLGIDECTIQASRSRHGAGHSVDHAPSGPSKSRDYSGSGSVAISGASS